MKLFDSHCHLDDEKFDLDRAEAIARMREAGVTRCTCVGSDLPSSRRCLDLAQQYDFIYAAAGVHPHEAKDAPADYLEQLQALLAQPKCVALGEIGLDYYYDLSPRETQMTVCEAQMELAWELSMPVAYHIRDAHQDMLDIMKRHKKHLTGGIIHCFSGSWEIAKEYLKLGYFISFAGPVTFKKAPKLQEAAVNVPLDRILIETDSPYLAPEPVRGRRNEPTNVRYVAEKVAALREIPLEAFAQITMQNALNAYSIKE